MAQASPDALCSAKAPMLIHMVHPRSVSTAGFQLHHHCILGSHPASSISGRRCKHTAAPFVVPDLRIHSPTSPPSMLAQRSCCGKSPSCSHSNEISIPGRSRSLAVRAQQQQGSPMSLDKGPLSLLEWTNKLLPQASPDLLHTASLSSCEHCSV